MQPEDIMTLPTDPTEEEKEIMKREQEEEMKKAMQKVFDSYRELGYNV